MCIDMKKLGFVHFALIVVLLSLLRVLLVLAGFIPPLSEMSLWNTIFFILTFIVIFAMGWRFYEDRWFDSAYKGAVTMAAAFLVVVAGLLIGRILGKQVLGLSIPTNFALFIVVVLNLLVYMLMGIILVLVGAFFGRMFKRKKKEKAKPKGRIAG